MIACHQPCIAVVGSAVSALPFPVSPVVLVGRPVFRPRPLSVDRKRAEGVPRLSVIFHSPRLPRRASKRIGNGRKITDDHDRTKLETFNIYHRCRLHR